MHGDYGGDGDESRRLDGTGSHCEDDTERPTALVRRDMANQIADNVKKAAPRAFYDPLVYDFVDEMQMTLDGRADLMQRFGVPEPATPAPTGKAG